jgi:hypothetical protein
MYAFDENALVQRLTGLKRELRVAFAAAAATRQMTCYSEQIPDRLGLEKDQIDAMLARLWSDLENKVINFDGWDETLSCVMSALPEEGDDCTVASALVDDGLSSLAYAIRCLITGDAQESAWAARRSYDAVDQVALRILDAYPGVASEEEKIRTHAVVQRELSRQSRDLSLLSIGSISEVKQLSFSDVFLDAAEMRACVEG